MEKWRFRNKDFCVTLLRGGAIGDFILTLPALYALRQHYRNICLRIIGLPDIAGLAHPDSIISQDSACLTSLYCRRPLLSPAIMNLFTGVDLLIAYAVDEDGILSENLQKVVRGQVLLHDPRPLSGSKDHVIDHLLIPIDKLGITIYDRVPHIDLKKINYNFAHDFWKRNNFVSPTVVVQPGSGGRHKCWPLKKFLRLLHAFDQVGIRTIFLLGEAEGNLEEYMTAPLPKSAVLLKSPKLLDLVGVLAFSDLFIGNDSGPGHVAAAVDTPTLILFGPTDPAIWGPRHPKSKILKAPDGQLTLLNVQWVLEAALESLALFNKIQKTTVCDTMRELTKIPLI